MFEFRIGSTISSATSRQLDAPESVVQQHRDQTIVEMSVSSQDLDAAMCDQVSDINAPNNALQGNHLSLLEDIHKAVNYVAIDMLENSEEPVYTDAMVQNSGGALLGDISGFENLTKSGSLTADSLRHVNPGLFEDSQHSTESSTYLQRAQLLLDAMGVTLCKLANNEFESTSGRVASNISIASAQIALTIGTLTTVRQLVGFAIEKCLQSNGAAPLTRSLIGGISLMVGPAMNILGAIRDEYNGTANTETRLARLATLSLSLAAFGAALAVPQALPALASFGPQMGFYTLANDLVQLFFKTSDNSQTTGAGTAANGGLYAALQFLAGTAMDRTAPNSGAGYAMSGTPDPSVADSGLGAQLMAWMERSAELQMNSNATHSSAEQIIESLEPIFGQDALRGAYNTGAEVVSKVVGGEIMHAFQNEKSTDGYRIHFAPRIPTASQVADQLLTTGAIRTSFGQFLMGAAISAGTFFGGLGLSASATNHAVNAVVAAVAFAGYPGFLYAHEGNPPEK